MTYNIDNRTDTVANLRKVKFIGHRRMKEWWMLRTSALSGYAEFVLFVDGKTILGCAPYRRSLHEE